MTQDKERMTGMEAAVRRYFQCWLDKDASALPGIFSGDVVYSESYGPEYRGLPQVSQWFSDWNARGTVLRWDTKRVIASGNTAVAEWYFECDWCGSTEGFDGVTIADFAPDGKIHSLKEFQSKAEHSFPYGK